MFNYAAAVTVERTAAEVFAAVNDIERWPQWTDMKDVRPDQTGAAGVGSTGTFSLPGPFTGPIRYELTEMVPDRRVTYEMTHRAFDWTAEISVEPRGPSSGLSTSGTFRLRGWWRLLQPIVAREVSRGEAAELSRIRALLEATSPSAVAV
jgi:hypothetical protein